MSAKSRRTSKGSLIEEFHSFFQGWLVRQESYREQLRSALRRSRSLNDEEEEHLRDLIARVLAHYQQYYEEKSRIANHEVSLVFSPPWFSCFEQSFFWIAGFKPGLAFRLLGASVEDLSRDQAEMMDRLRAETREEERRLEKDLARVQEGVAAPPVVELTRQINWSYEEMGPAVEALRGELEVVVANADMLRTRTAERLVEILTPLQNLRFLAAVAELQMKIRIRGCHFDGDGDGDWERETPPAGSAF